MLKIQHFLFAGLFLSVFATSCGSDVDSSCAECSQQAAPLAKAIELEPELKNNSDLQKPTVSQTDNDVNLEAGSAPLGNVDAVPADREAEVKKQVEALKAKQSSTI